MGRLVSGGRMAEYDVVISQGKLPKSTSLKAIASPNGVANANAVIDQLSRLADKEVENYAGAHQFQVDTGSLKVNGGGAKPDAAARAAELKAQGVPRDEAIRKMQEEGYK
jgi:hypothetical protein